MLACVQTCYRELISPVADENQCALITDELFALFDRDGSGEIDLNEIKTVFVEVRDLIAKIDL